VMPALSPRYKFLIKIKGDKIITIFVTNDGVTVSDVLELKSNWELAHMIR
jgi:hypothetical protein